MFCTEYPSTLLSVTHKFHFPFNPSPPPPKLKKTRLLVIMHHWPLHSLLFEWVQSVERLYCKRPILCLVSSKILTPHLLTARRLWCVPPRFWCGGRTHSLGGKGVGGQYFGRRQTLLCTLHTYCKQFVVQSQYCVKCCALINTPRPSLYRQTLPQHYVFRHNLHHFEKTSSMIKVPLPIRVKLKFMVARIKFRKVNIFRRILAPIPGNTRDGKFLNF
jgi:hypothetical protein